MSAFPILLEPAPLRAALPGFVRLKPTRARFTIAEAARRLGVSKPHLWYVVNGHRISRSLTRRYTELKRTSKNQNP